MKYKVGDKVKIRKGSLAGNIYTISRIESCGHIELSDLPYVFFDYELELVVPTLVEIKEKKLTCVIHTPTRNGAEIIVNTIPVDDERTIDRDWSSFWDIYKDDTCYKIVDGELYSYQDKEFFENNSYTIYEFSDLFPIGSTMVCGNGIYKHTESGIANYKLVPEYKEGGIVTLKPRDESVSFASAPYLDLSSLILPTNSWEVEEKINKELAEHFNVFPNNGISAKNGGKNSMKFTFYVKEGTRIDKSCNKTIPTMTTFITAESYGDSIYHGAATCDKADYDERQGCLEAIANAVLGGDFDRDFNRAVKANELADKKKRTCTYCGQLFDTVEEKQAHEAWHVERKKARRERYLLRKRAKEIAFEEAAQKLAKEMIEK